MSEISKSNACTSIIPQSSLYNTHPHALVRRIISFLTALFTVSALFLSSGCSGGGHGNDNAAPPSNVGGGFTLVASGGTLNDGSGVNGLSILATIRDGQGWGPALPWTITITGPNIPANNPLTVEYSDSRYGSYIGWEWAGYDPVPGLYRVTATNGSVTIYYEFSLNAVTIARPAPNASTSGNSITVSWPAVSGAGSYAYDVCSPESVCVSGITANTSEIVSFASITTGDYFIQVKAYATDRESLFVNHVASPALAPQENISEYYFTFPVGGNQASDNYAMNAAGGVLDYGLSGPSGAIYGLPIWLSIQDSTNAQNPVAPAGDWNVVITDPHGKKMNFIYPAGLRHYAYWYYGIEPVVGSYAVTATYGTASKTATFSLTSTAPHLAPLSYNQISAALVPNTINSSVNDISLSWPSVSGAKSYQASLWADVWNNATSQYDYSEVWSGWVNTTSARVLHGSVTSGLTCDVYVNAYEVDMTSVAPPSSNPLRADMSENYYGYPLPFLTP